MKEIKGRLNALPLPLLVLGVDTDHKHLALAADNLALGAALAH
jgi:hypothetical protein